MVKRDRSTHSSQIGSCPMYCRLGKIVSRLHSSEPGNQISDHYPLLVSLTAGCHGKKRFHFESFWTKLPGFHEVVADSWGQEVTIGCPMERISVKLKRLTRALHSWGQKQVGHIKSQLGVTREILHRIEIAQDSRKLTSDENSLRCELKRHSMALSSLEQTVARLS